jgi:hypothetical protein
MVIPAQHGQSFGMGVPCVGSCSSLLAACTLLGPLLPDWPEPLTLCHHSCLARSLSSCLVDCKTHSLISALATCSTHLPSFPERGLPRPQTQKPRGEATEEKSELSEVLDHKGSSLAARALHTSLDFLLDTELYGRKAYPPEPGAEPLHPLALGLDVCLSRCNLTCCRRNSYKKSTIIMKAACQTWAGQLEGCPMAGPVLTLEGP